MQKKADITHKTFDQHDVGAYGSIREKKVNPDLQEERELRDFDQKELTRLIYGGQYEKHLELKELVGKTPELQAGI